MGDQGFDDGQLDAAGGGGAHPRHQVGGQHVQIYGEIEVIAAGDKGVQPRQQHRQLGLGHLLVQHMPDSQRLGAGKERRRVGGLGHPEAGVSKGRALGGALLGYLEEGGARACLLLLHAQIEVGIEVDDADPALATQMAIEAAPAAEGHLVAPPQHQREVTQIQRTGDPLGQPVVGGIEIAVLAGQIAAVMDGTAQMPGAVGEQLAHRQRGSGGADPPLVAAHPFVTGKTEQHHAGLAVGLPGLHLVVPAQGQFTIFRILAPLPDRHVGRVELIHGASPPR
ncbi:hypothetical protein D3C72_683410 [compost metagenome]